MYRLIATLMILSMTTSLYALGEPTFKVTPIQTVACDDLPNNLSFKFKPFGYSKGFQVHYLIEGENLVAIKKESLKVEYIKGKDGKDISKLRGKDTYKLGSFPKVSDDGKYALFSVASKSNQFGKVDSLELKGSITLFSASKNEKKSLEATIGTTQKIGPLSITVSQDKYKDSRIVVDVSNAHALIDLKLIDGDKEYKAKNSSWRKQSRHYKFEKPKNTTFTLKASYWIEMKELSIPFGIQ